MYQAPARIWNSVAETGLLRTEFGRRLFPLGSAELLVALEAEERRLEAEGVKNPVIQTSFLYLAPVLWERLAIGRAKALGTIPQSSLPNVEDVGEAIYLASMDNPLTVLQQNELRQLLQAPPL